MIFLELAVRNSDLVKLLAEAYALRTLVLLKMEKNLLYTGYFKCGEFGYNDFVRRASARYITAIHGRLVPRPVA